MDRLRGSAGLVGFFVVSVLAVSACSSRSADSTVDSAVGSTVDSAVDPTGSSVSSTSVTTLPAPPRGSYDPDEFEFERSRRMLRPVGECEVHYLYGVSEAAAKYSPDDPLAGFVKAGDVDGFSAVLDGVDDPGDLDKAIDLAASSGCIELIEVALDHGANPDVRWDDFYPSPLFLAVASQSPGAVALLVEAGADPNVLNSDHESPLHLAVNLEVLQPFGSGMVEIVRILLGAGGDPNLGPALGQCTPLTNATYGLSLPMVQVLLEGGAVPRPYDLLAAAREIKHPSTSYPATAITGLYLERGVRLDGWVPEGEGEVGSLLLSEGNDVAVEYIEYYLNWLEEES